MTTEEKVKEYDKAVERAKDCLTDRKFCETEDTIRSVMEYIFPQLAESENGRIIRLLRELGSLDAAKELYEEFNLSYTDVLYWLEKQKELPFVKDVVLGYPGHYFYDGERMHFCGNPAMEEKQKEQKPLTTEETELNSIAFLEQMGYTCIPPRKEQKLAESRKRNKPKESWLSNAKYEIEHADELLTQRQEELREIRELKKQEQKPVEKQDYSGLNDLERAIHRGFLSTGVENVPVTIIKETAKECLAQMKPTEWSEEDEKVLNSISNVVCGVGIQSNGGLRKKQVSWLKSLPERFNLQPKQEWSEVELEFRGEKVKIKRPFFRDDKGSEYSTTEQDEEVAWNALRAWCEKKGVSLYDLYPKEEWNEEDEGELQNAIDALEFLGKKGMYKSESGYDAALQAASWLKSLTLNLKKKNKDVAKLCSNEWSEEDKQYFDDLIARIEKSRSTNRCYVYSDDVDWLKSKFDGNSCK